MERIKRVYEGTTRHKVAAWVCPFCGHVHKQKLSIGERCVCRAQMHERGWMSRR